MLVEADSEFLFWIHFNPNRILQEELLNDKSIDIRTPKVSSTFFDNSDNNDKGE